MMTRSLRISLLALVVATCFSATANVAFAGEPISGDPLRDGIDFYKHQKFDDAEKCLEAAIAANPNSAPAHYYMANCYLALGKFDEASKSYEICLKMQPPADIAAYSKKMLAAIAQRTAGGGGAQQAQAPAQPASPINAFNSNKFDEQIQDMKRKNHARAIDAANARISTLLAQIDKLRKQMQLDQESDPLYYFRRGRQRPNPPAMQSAAATQLKITDLENQIIAIKNECARDVERSDAQIERTFSELKSQARSSKGNIKPVLTSRSVYVRDYVHFTGDEPPPEFVITPMKATAGKYTGGPKQ